MARNRKPTPTRAVIIKAASELFFEHGFSKTTSTALCQRADISSGNLTFYFPTKEHILAVLVKMMCDYQWQEMEKAANEGKSSLLAYCLELTTLVAISEEFPEMQDFVVAAYTHPMTLDLIRANDAEKIKQVFAEYTAGWSEEAITETEALISGIEYATVMKTEHSASVARRLEGALDAIMRLLGVPEDLRQRSIARVLAMDYLSIGRKVYRDFCHYVTETNEHALEEILKNTKIRAYKL
jgi:AcrR family transcriptional regulator